MSASIRDNLLLRKRDKTLKDYSLLFLADYYFRIGELGLAEKDAILSGLDIPTEYTLDQLIKTMLTTEYEIEEYITESLIGSILLLYLRLTPTPLITQEEYDGYLTLMGTLQEGE